MLAGGIVCIIFALPLLLFAFFGVIGTMPDDPGSAIVLGMVFAFPGLILLVFGIGMIRKSQAQVRLRYEQMEAAQQQWSNGNPNGNHRYPPSQPQAHPNLSGGPHPSQQPGVSYQIHNPLDPRTAAYMNQRGGRTKAVPTSPPNPAYATNQPKTIDCPGCGAPQTLVPQQSRECEYCGTVVAYK